MGAAFGLGSIAPILPHLFLTDLAAVIASVTLTLAVLFGIGVVKSRWTHRSWLTSGLEILAIGAVAGVAGYFFGTVLPVLLGAPRWRPRSPRTPSRARARRPRRRTTTRR